MSFNRGNLRDDVRRRLEEFATDVINDTDINIEIQYCLDDIQNKIDFKELQTSDTTNVTTVEDQQEYTLPTTNGVIRKIIDISINQVHYEEIDFLDRDNVRGSDTITFPDVKTSVNAYYLYSDTIIGFVPIPVSTGTAIKFYYYREHPEILDDSTNYLLPDLVREAMVTRVTAGVMKADETIPNATIETEMSRYDELVALAREHLSHRSRKFIRNYTNY